MATLVVDVQNNIEANKVADAIRLLKSVQRVFIMDEEFERIPGLAYSHKERLADISRAEEDYAAGRTITADELNTRMAAW
jgi:hypothetical protein